MIRQCVPVLKYLLVFLRSYLFARRIAVHLAVSSSPRKNGSRKVENETKLGRSRIERVKGGNRVRTWESKRKDLWILKSQREREVP